MYIAYIFCGRDARTRLERKDQPPLRSSAASIEWRLAPDFVAFMDATLIVETDKWACHDRKTGRLDAALGEGFNHSMMERPPIVLTRLDHERLDRLLAAERPRVDVEALRDELERARIVEPEEIPRDVVTMNSMVRFTSEETGAETEVTLVFPGKVDFAKGQVSVLAPVGSALLGLAVGDVIEWPLPNGRSARLRVVAVTYQPEAAGDYQR